MAGCNHSGLGRTPTQHVPVIPRGRWEQQDYDYYKRADNFDVRPREGEL
jgi:hypothetical protein